MPELNDWALVASNLVIVLLIGGAILRHGRKDKAVSARPDAGITFIFNGSTLVEQRLIWGQKTLSRKAIDALPARLPTAPQNLALTTPDGSATLLSIRKISGGATVISFTAAENSTTTQDAEKTHKVSA